MEHITVWKTLGLPSMRRFAHTHVVSSDELKRIGEDVSLIVIAVAHDGFAEAPTREQPQIAMAEWIGDDPVDFDHSTVHRYHPWRSDDVNQ